MFHTKKTSSTRTMGNVTSICVANATNKVMYVKVDVEKIYLKSLNAEVFFQTPAGQPV